MNNSSHAKLDSIAWPLARLGELIDALARLGGLVSNPQELPPFGFTDAEHIDTEKLSKWIDIAAGNLDLEAESIEAFYAEVENVLKVGGPAILRIPGSNEIQRPQLIALLNAGRRRVRILTPELTKRKLALEDLRSLICSPYETPIVPALDQFLTEAQIQPERLKKARKAILREQLATVRIHMGWILRYPPGTNIWKQIRYVGALKPLFLMLFLYGFQQILAILSWFILGRGIFMGHYDTGWLFAWGILLLATIPLSVFISDAQNELSLRTGAIFKSRLLHGTLKLEAEEIRHQGMGQFLGRVMESEAVEMFAINGGLLALLSFVELFFAGFILLKGAGSQWHAVILGLWVIFVSILLVRYARKAIKWTETYQEMTNDLVENMVGHRTRLAQEQPKDWHTREDQVLVRYLRSSESLDAAGIWLNSLTARGWLLVGITWLVFSYIANQATPQALAISLGGVLYATQALNKLVAGFQSLVALFLAWKQVGPLFQAASRPREVQSLVYYDYPDSRLDESPEVTATHINVTQGELVNARDLSFRYSPQSKLVLENCDVKINSGERLLLMGPSGSGKSTLVAILAGLRKPEAGSLLLNGVDRQILGTEEWRRRIVMAPQFQENHVFSETFAFNLLMGRRWPPLPEDLEEAEAVCKDLGLDAVLKRMPSGFQQMLGESGWQLSHGERSRLFIARTLLQSAEMIILDESFGALDAENLQRALDTVEQRANTLLVIAHP